MLRKLAVSFFLLIISLFLIPSASFAQEASPSAATLPTTVSPTSPLFTDILIYNTFHTFSCIGIGRSVIGQPCLTYQISKNAQGMVEGVPVLSSVDTSGGVLGTTTSLIGALYTNPPIRTADYLASLGKGMGIVKEAHAQVGGSGSNVLSPILRLWEVSRNISYVIMIIIFVIIGLMVMFRQRINPQTVITAQAALPGLVIGLILITFSYFMAALISDMAFVGTNIVGYYFAAARGDNQDLVDEFSRPDPATGRNPNVISIFSRFAGVSTKEKISATLDSFWDDIHTDAQRLLVILAGFVSTQIAGQGAEVFKAIPQFGEGIVAGIQAIAFANAALNPKAMVGVFLALIITAILLYVMFKLLLKLITIYLNIIFLTISAPFQFLAAALPGRQGIATSWILNMLSYVLAFPAVIAVFYFVAFILGPSNAPGGSFYPFRVSDSGITPENGAVSTAYAQAPVELVGNNTFPIFGGMDLNFIKLLLAFGALIATPAIPDIISRTIGRVGQAGQLIGQEFSGGLAQGRGYGQQFQQGLGGISSQGARARQLFATPAYRATGFDAAGNPTGWAPSGWQYQPGLAGKFKIWANRPGPWYKKLNPFK